MELRKKFLHHVERQWEWVNHNDTKFKKKIPKSSGVYVLVGCDVFNNVYDIMYVGSCINLLKRIQSHSIIKKIESIGNHHRESAMCCVVYFKKFEKGFFDFEIKLIRKLKPIFNKKLYTI